MDLQTAGVHIAALIDARPNAKCDLDVPLLPGAQVQAAHGRTALEAITFLTASGGQDRIHTDCLALSGGEPSVHLSCHMGARPVWKEAIAAFVPAQHTALGMKVADAAGQLFSTHDCLKSGIDAANDALDALSISRPAGHRPKAQSATYNITPLWAVPGRGREWIDFQNDVTVKDVKQAVEENFRYVEHMKRYTTLGMAPDQGKNANIGA